MAEYLKPLPLPDHVTEEFWKGAKRHELMVQRCQSCNEHFLAHREVCPKCLSSKLEWVKASGKGRVYTYTVVRQAPRPAFASDLPYAVAIVQLEEGPKLQTQMVGCKVEDVKVDMAVTVAFDDVTGEISLPKFKPA